jgi:hypothetical protein
MWLRIAAVSDIAYVRDVPQAFYRVHPTSMMRSKYNGQMLDLYQRRAVFDSFFKNYGHNNGRQKLYDSARRALAREALWDACRAYDHNKLRERNAEELVQFAQETYPSFATLPEFRALTRRQRLGPVWCNRTQLFAMSALIRRADHWRKKRRWKKMGV